MVRKKLIALIENFEKKFLPTWLLALLVIIFIFRIPSFFEPFSYGDEMIYLTLGHGVRAGRVLYSGLHDNKPPLLYLVAAIAGNVFWFRVMLAGWMLTTTVFFSRLADTLFPKNKNVTKISTIVFAILTTIPLLEGNIANAELFMIGPIILAFYILITQKNTLKNLFFAGVLFSVSTLFKVPALFDIPAIILYWLVSTKLTGGSFLRITKKTIYLFAGLVAPIIITFIWYFLRGAFSEYLFAAFAQNVGYLSSWRPSDNELGFFVRNKPLIIRFTILIVLNISLLIKRKHLSKNFIFISSWLFFALFAITLSERPYPHYLIQAVPAISLLVGLLFAGKTISQVYTIIPLAIAFLVPVYFKFWHYPTLPYYTRFVNFISGKIDKEEYINSFGGSTSRNYQISDFLTTITTKKDKVFVWGDSSAIYAISRRLPPIKYVADYHIRDFYSKEKVIEKISDNKPQVIVILPESESFPELSKFTNSYYIYLTNIQGAEIWKLINPSARSAIAKN